MLQVIKQVGIFMICAQMLLHFKPAESYGKYLKLLISLMVLAQLVVPLFTIFGQTGETAFFGRISFYEEALSGEMEKINITCVTAEKMLENLTMKEIKTRINNEKEGVQGTEGDEEEKGEEEILVNKIEVAAGD